MHLYRGELHRRNGVSHRHAGVGKAPGIDDDSGHVIAALLNHVDDGAFVIGLKALDLDADLFALFSQGVVDLRQSDATVDVGFTGAKQVQVRPMNHPDHRMNRRMWFSGRCHSSA